MASGLRSADSVPALVKDICRKERWRERIDEQTGQRWDCKTFEEFVTASLLRGLGTTVETLKALCGEDTEATDAIDEAMQRKRGGGKNQYTECQLDNIQEAQAPTGTSRERSLRKLRTEAEKSPKVKKVYERVLAGEISPNRGMVECGFRKVPTPLEAARKAVAKLSPKDREVLLAELSREP
jgi:hypothetical protein